MSPGSASPHAQNEVYADLQRELAQFLLRALVAASVLVIFVSDMGWWPAGVAVVGILLIALQSLVWQAFRHSYALGAGLLVAGCLVLELAALALWPSPATLYLFAVPLGLAALLINLPVALVLGAALSAFAIYATGRLAELETLNAVTALLLLWGVAALHGTVMHLARRATGSLWTAYMDMHRELQAARNQRLELKEVQEDLLHANSELARVSERLQWMYRVAEEALHAKEQFVANVSHELRTPLNMIIGFSEMISDDPDAYGVLLPQSLLADVGVILRNSRHLASLVDDVLDLSQVEAGRMSLNKEWADLREMASEALVAVRPLLEAKQLHLEYSAPDDLPLLFCDRTRIRQVLLNLVSNAARFTERGGVRVQVRVERGEVLVSVADSGPGIAAEHQEHIFQPFEQADSSTRRRYGGTGLGLSISRRFVEMHGGRMWLESEIGRGSTFSFALPVPSSADAPQESAVRWLSAYHQEHPRTRASKAPRPDSRSRFLVLEPANVLQRLLSRYLEGYEIAGVRSLAEAVAELSHSPAQALIVNDPAAQMGDDVAEQMARLPFGTPAIACWVPGEEQAAARLGVVRYLLKPVSREGLCAALDGVGPDVRTVLLVDDDGEVLQLFGRMLASSGRDYHVLRASNGQWALQALRERKPDIMLLDLVMAGMDGYTVLEQKKADPEIRDIPVIAVSALDPVQDSVISNTLTLVRSGGLTLEDLLECIRMWSRVKPVLAPDDPELREGFAG